MPAWPSFVPIVQEILALAVRGQMSERNLEVGQTLGESLPAMATRATVGVIGPDGTRKDVRMTLDAQASRWSFADTKQSGVYAIDHRPRGSVCGERRHRRERLDPTPQRGIA